MSDSGKPENKAPTRETQRAEALRANLLRRKAQARGRDETQDALPPKTPGDA